MAYCHSMTNNAERRKWKRVPAGFDVSYRIGEQSGVAEAMDISTGGLFVVVDPPPRIGDRVYLTFLLPGDEPTTAIRAIGEVVRTVAPAASRQGGCGVSIVAMPLEAKRVLAEFIERASVVTLEHADLGGLNGTILEIEAKTK
ncbi:MAG: PilZ domain-containing protein [Deltaproteobacteria bacterium]|nr:PilZ domain-containing protein [Deltaproteobacteria bacterium]